MRPPELLLLRELDDLDTDGDGEEDRVLEALDGEGLEDRLLRVGVTVRVRLEVELETRLREGVGREVVRAWVELRVCGVLRRTVVVLRVVGVELRRMLARLVAPGERTELTLLRPELRTELVRLGTYLVSLPESWL
jgi:hypothetical protein